VLDDPGYRHCSPCWTMRHRSSRCRVTRLLSAVGRDGGRPQRLANGQRMAESLAAALARSVVVVSGLARGIDAPPIAARSPRPHHRYRRGGLDLPYRRKTPPCKSGSPNPAPWWLSAARHGPQARHFPRRNRIIAGLSLGVVVVEAATRSGSLITARIAQDIGREVFAVPGSPTDPRARGANDLLRQGRS